MTAPELKALGYRYGNVIISEAFPNTPLIIGFGIVWSPYSHCFVVGCRDKEGEYYTSVPLFNTDDNRFVSELIITRFQEGDN